MTVIELVGIVRDALTDEDEIAHGEAVKEGPDGYIGLGVCAYDDSPWPCHTQRAIDRLLARLAAIQTLERKRG